MPLARVGGLRGAIGAPKDRANAKPRWHGKGSVL